MQHLTLRHGTVSGFMRSISGRAVWSLQLGTGARRPHWAWNALQLRQLRVAVFERDIQEERRRVPCVQQQLLRGWGVSGSVRDGC